MSKQDADVNTDNYGKTGGEADSFGGSGSFALAGEGVGCGEATVVNVDPLGTGIGQGGGAGSGSGAHAGAIAGSVSDNTSIGQIDIS